MGLEIYYANETKELTFYDIISDSKKNTPYASQKKYKLGESLIEFLYLDVESIKEKLTEIPEFKGDVDIEFYKKQFFEISGKYDEIYDYCGSLHPYFYCFNSDTMQKVEAALCIISTTKQVSDKEITRNAKTIGESIFQDMDLISNQESFLKAIEACLDVDNQELKELSTIKRFFVFNLSDLLFKRSLTMEIEFEGFRPDVFFDYQEILDFRSNGKVNAEKLLKIKNSNIHLNEFYYIKNMYSACYLEFYKMVISQVKLRKCKLCNKYFILDGRADALYCEKCAVGGAQKAYKLKIEGNDLLKLYNKEYQKRYAKIRNIVKGEMKESKKKELTNWVKIAKLKMDEKGLTIEAFKTWIDKN